MAVVFALLGIAIDGVVSDAPEGDFRRWLLSVTTKQATAIGAVVAAVLCLRYFHFEHAARQWKYMGVVGSQTALNSDVCPPE